MNNDQTTEPSEQKPWPADQPHPDDALPPQPICGAIGRIAGFDGSAMCMNEPGHEGAHYGAMHFSWDQSHRAIEALAGLAKARNARHVPADHEFRDGVCVWCGKPQAEHGAGEAAPSPQVSDD